MDWTIQDHGDFLTVTTRGHFDIERHAQLVADVLSSPSWRPGRHVLFDHRELSFDGARYPVMDAAVATHRAHDEGIGDGRAAMLMKNLADFGIGRMFEGIAGDGVSAKLRVFLDEEAARRWILTGEDTGRDGS